jgi:hypothetical protein
VSTTATTATRATDTASTDQVRSSAPAPKAGPAAVVTGVLGALVLLAIAVVFVHDALAAAGAISENAWLDAFVEKAKAISATSTWMIWAGPLAVVVGIVLVVLALKPRRSTHFAVGDNGVYIGRSDAARLAANAASRTPAVVAADGSAKGRGLRLAVQTVSADTASVAREAEQAAAQRLGALSPTPSVRSTVTVKED